MILDFSNIILNFSDTAKNELDKFLLSRGKNDLKNSTQF